MKLWNFWGEALGMKRSDYWEGRALFVRCLITVLLRCWNVCLWSRETGNSSAARQSSVARTRSTKSRRGGTICQQRLQVCLRVRPKPNVPSFPSSLRATVRIRRYRGRQPLSRSPLSPIQRYRRGETRSGVLDEASPRA